MFKYYYYISIDMPKNNAALLVIVLLLFAQIPLLFIMFGNNNDPIIFLAHAKKSLSSSASHHITRTRGRTKISSPLSPLTSAARPPPIPASSIGSNNAAKVVMINFDDGWKSQFLYAKPILDQYGFKASFFIVCGKVAAEPYWMTWPQVTALKNDGMDIESHTMTHPHLTDFLSNPARLNYEIGGAKQCLADHGFRTTIFGYPLNLGSGIPQIVNLVAQYYDFARTGSHPLMFLNCNGFVGHPHQADCRMFDNKGNLTYANRYDIRSDSFTHINNNHDFNTDQMYAQFVARMNSQIPFNANGRINAIPIIVYHNLTYNMQDYNSEASTNTVPEFAREMKYLHDNGFKVLVLNQFAYDPNNNVFYVANNNNVTSHSGRIAATTTTTATRTPINTP